MPSAVPVATAKETSETMSTFGVIASTRRSSSIMAGVALADTGCLHRVLGHRFASASLLSVENQVDADRDQRDREDGNEHGPRLDSQCDAVLADHQAPVGGGRLQTE